MLNERKSNKGRKCDDWGWNHDFRLSLPSEFLAGACQTRTEEVQRELLVQTGIIPSNV